MFSRLILSSALIKKARRSTASLEAFAEAANNPIRRRQQQSIAIRPEIRLGHLRSKEQR